MIATLTFEPDGLVRGLYTEAIDLLQLGVLHIERATTIEFDNEGQKWRVRDTSGKELYMAAKRQECLDWERQHFSHQHPDLDNGEQEDLNTKGAKVAKGRKLITRLSAVIANSTTERI